MFSREYGLPEACEDIYEEWVQRIEALVSVCHGLEYSTKEIIAVKEIK